MRHSLIALSCLLILCYNTSAKPINQDRDLKIAHGSIDKLLYPATEAALFKPRTVHLTTKTFAKRNSTGTWTVQAGDTGNRIAATLSITFVQLAFLNPTAQWLNLQIGQVLNIPCSDSSTGSTTYTVVAGDTGNAIAARYGIAFQQLSAFNPGVNWYNLQIGQVLLIPAPSVDANRLASITDMNSGKMDGDAPATSSISETPSFDDGIYHPSSPSASMDVDTVDISNESTPQPDPMDNKSPFLTPGESSKSIKLRLIRDGMQERAEDESLLNPGSQLPQSSTTSIAYTVKAGDTGYAIAVQLGISFSDLDKANPGITWTNLQIGQSLNLPPGTKLPTTSRSTFAVATLPTPPLLTRGTPSPTPFSQRTPKQDIYSLFAGAANEQNYPPISQWISIDNLWTANLRNIGTSCVFQTGSVPVNTQSETATLRASILQIAVEASVNPSFILAMILQESNGCVRAPTTTSFESIKNPGLLQSYKGNST